MKPRRHNPRRPAEKNQRASALDGCFVVEGIAALAEYARLRRQAVKRVFATKQGMAAAERVLSQLALQVQIVDPRDRDGDGALSRQSPVWAEIEVAALSEDQLFTRLAQRRSKISKDFVLVLDHVSDPRNLGAIVRTAAFFGVTEVIVAERRQALLSQAAIATAQGGFAITDLCVVTNIGRTIDQLKENEYWILGADMAGESASGLAGFYDRVALVMGSEDQGLATGIRSRCDRIVSIAGTAGGLDSLNVSVATGILVHALRPQNEKTPLNP